MLLETYAIMTYCSFSKILKKHDKVSGHNTREPYMSQVVQPANFSHYPELLQMIETMQELYEQVSEEVVKQQGGKPSQLYEDERLFIHMIQQLNEQVLSTEDDQDDTNGMLSSSSSKPKAKKNVSFSKTLGGTPNEDGADETGDASSRPSSSSATAAAAATDVIGSSGDSLAAAAPDTADTSTSASSSISPDTNERVGQESPETSMLRSLIESNSKKRKSSLLSATAAGGSSSDMGVDDDEDDGAAADDDASEDVHPNGGDRTAAAAAATSTTASITEECTEGNPTKKPRL